MVPNILIGTDPELFVQQNNKYMSAHGLIPGSKEAPYPVNNGAVQVDGMALEFNTDPADTEDGFIFNINSVMAQLKSMVPGYEVVTHATAVFDHDYMASQPAEALELGCDPDYNAYSGDMNQPPDNTTNMRTAAGHVHVGWTEDAGGPEHITLCRQLTRQLDLYLGVPSVILDPDTDRRKMYGQAGAFRPKTYGVEYRVLSNFWLQDEELMRWVFQGVHHALKSIKRGVEADYYYPQQAITHSDTKLSEMLIAQYDIPMPTH